MPCIVRHRMPEARLPFNAWRHRGLVMRVGGPGQALRCRGQLAGLAQERGIHKTPIPVGQERR